MKIIIAVLMLAAQVGTAPKTTVTITEDQNGQTVHVRKIDDVVVTFVAPSGTGYEWQMEPTSKAAAKEEDVPLKPGLPGGPVKTMFHVRVKKTVTLHFNYFRAWEKNTPPAKTFSVKLKISG